MDSWGRIELPSMLAEPARRLLRSLPLKEGPPTQKHLFLFLY